MFDESILMFIQQYIKCEPLDFIMPMITKLGDNGIIWIVLTLILLVFKRHRKWGIAMALSLFLCFIVGNLTLKPLIARIRPYEVITGIELLISKPHDFSFPSGHTMTSFAGAWVVFCANKKWGIAALVLASLIAFSRMYLFVHYPTDIIVGMVMGILFAIISVKLVKCKFKRY